MRTEEKVESLVELLYALRKETSSEKKTEIMDSIDLLFEQLYLKVEELKAFGQSGHDPHRVNLERANYLNESLEIIQRNYAPIFNNLELATLMGLSKPESTIFLNRSKLESKLIAKVSKYTQNLEKYVAVELGYSKQDSIPWAYETNICYTIDKEGKIELYKNEISDLIFIPFKDFISKKYTLNPPK